MAKGIALLQIYVCSAEGKVGKGFKALSGFRGKNISININQVRRSCKKLLWRWQPLWYLQMGSLGSLKGCIPLLRVVINLCRPSWRLEGAFRALFGIMRSYPTPSGSTSSVLPSPCHLHTPRLRLWGRNGGECCLWAGGGQGGPLREECVSVGKTGSDVLLGSPGWQQGCEELWRTMSPCCSKTY